MRLKDGQIGRVWWSLLPRGDDRRRESWAGVGPVVDSPGDFHDPKRHVSGIEFYAGRFALAIGWN